MSCNSTWDIPAGHHALPPVSLSYTPLSIQLLNDPKPVGMDMPKHSSHCVGVEGSITFH